MRAIAIMVVGLMGTASHAASFSKTEASGLAHVIALASKCGYTVSTEKLSVYYKGSGFDNPEALAWIKHKQNMEAAWAPDATPADCTMAEATGRGIDIIK